MIMLLVSWDCRDFCRAKGIREVDRLRNEKVERFFAYARERNFMLLQLKSVLYKG